MPSSIPNGIGQNVERKYGNSPFIYSACSIAGGHIMPMDGPEGPGTPFCLLGGCEATGAVLSVRSLNQNASAVSHTAPEERGASSRLVRMPKAGLQLTSGILLQQHYSATSHSTLPDSRVT